MNDVRARLIECFTLVFPNLPPESVVSATVDTVESWDSTSHLTLMQVTNEAFGIQIPEAVFGEIESFEGLERYLAQQLKA